MRDDESSEPSLLLARHHIHLHRHKNHHNRQAEDTATALASTITQVTTTISVVQQIDVDSNGSTFSVFTIPETSSGAQAVLTDTASPAAASSSPAASGAVSTTSSQSSGQGASIASTFTLSTSPSFASLLATSNSTTCKCLRLEPTH